MMPQSLIDRMATKILDKLRQNRDAVGDIQDLYTRLQTATCGHFSDTSQHKLVIRWLTDFVNEKYACICTPEVMDVIITRVGV